ncbi:MAG TPA: hypothetical protein VL522_17440 [Bordetella sp.]|jgi:hypothetical protein|nr:hypothetical protein [Bordetella sp.]
MKTLGSILQLVLLVVLCASVASCADAGSRQASREAQSAPGATNQAANNVRGGPQPALTIQAGEGEKLNLPWFIRDAQDWVNSDSSPSAPWQSVK